jgi:outer membrane receptor protein involved in Fe transport
MDDYTTSQIAPSGDFGGNASFNCSNPFLSPSELDLFCGGSTAGLSNPNIYILRRNAEGGNRLNSLEHMDFREVLGLKGKIDDVWSYDLSYNYSLVNLNSDVLNYFSYTKLNNALNVTGTAAHPVCISGAPGCVPYNLFQPGGVTQAALNYLYTPGIQVGRIFQHDAILNLTGDLGRYGIQVPGAASGLAVNLGAEYREAKSSTLPDEELQTGDLAGTGGPTEPVTGELVAREGFIEARLPIMEDRPGVHLVDAETGYRYSDYSLGFKTNTYKFGVDYSPVQDVRLRGSFQRASRAPNVVELFTPSSVGLDGTYAADPCSGAAPSFSLAQCEKTGVTAAQYGHIAANPAGQYNGLLGGNTGLKPETAITKSIGIGFTPSILPNFRAQIDYYDINIQNVIQQIGGANILTQCANSGVLCNLINRGPNGTLWTTNAGFLVDTLLNVGDLDERGIDADIAYSYDFGAFGKVHANLVGTWIDKYENTPIALSPGTAYNCAGYYGPSCSSPTSGAGTPVFKWRHRFITTWQTPWSGLDLSLTWRYYSAVQLESLSGNPNLTAGAGNTIANGGISNTDAYLSSYSYFDLTAAVKLADKLTVRLGCNNVLDKNPPLIGTADASSPPTFNGNTYPGVYDALGRYVFAEVTAQF